MPDQEIIVTDPKTGGMKGEKLARFDLIPVDVLWELAVHYGKGASKYADRNWERGYKWSSSYAALQRHLTAWWGGEDEGIDEKFGTFDHLVAALWHCVALMAFTIRGIGTDDRPGSGAKLGNQPSQELPPDHNCITRGDGECVSTKPCMHWPQTTEERL